MNTTDLKEFLEYKIKQYNTIDFIKTDPISIPKQYDRKEDIEIAAFLTALLSWGNRKAIIKAANNLFELMDEAPYDFVLNHTEANLSSIESFVYRTCQPYDMAFFVKSLQNIYTKHSGLENVFTTGFNTDKSIYGAINYTRTILLQLPHAKRVEKHVSSPENGSAAKRINMFLRWMCRKDKSGVDFGLWNDIPQQELMCPLDVHSGRVARLLGLLYRKQNDWKAVEELTLKSKEFFPDDPVAIDFALFGLGVFEKLL